MNKWENEILKYISDMPYAVIELNDYEFKMKAYGYASKERAKEEFVIRTMHLTSDKYLFIGREEGLIDEYKGLMSFEEFVESQGGKCVLSANMCEFDAQAEIIIKKLPQEEYNNWEYWKKEYSIYEKYKHYCKDYAFSRLRNIEYTLEDFKKEYPDGEIKGTLNVNYRGR